jgi:hypothetical protein
MVNGKRVKTIDVHSQWVVVMMSSSSRSTAQGSGPVVDRRAKGSQTDKRTSRSSDVVVCAASRSTTVGPVSTGTPLPLLMASHSEASFSHVAWSAGLGAIAAIR